MVYFMQRLVMIMHKNLLRRCILAFSLALAVSPVCASDHAFFDLHYSGSLRQPTDPLAPRDEWGLLHQTAFLYPTDFAFRHTQRFDYYWRSGRQLIKDPAYVGALQVVLRNRGFYCGPIDGIMSEDVSDAIAKVQKSFRQRVTGELTIPVRRALHLP